MDKGTELKKKVDATASPDPSSAPKGTAEPKVVRLPTPEAKQTDAPSRIAWWIQNWKLSSALLVCLLPTLLTALYVFAIASPRYAVEVQFAVRSQDSTFIDASGILGALGGATDSASTDSYMVADYVQSVDFVANLQKFVDLEALYASGEIDFLSRMSTDIEIERLVRFWKSITSVYFDNTKGTIVLEVSAFEPSSAVVVAEATLQLAEELVNRISRESRIESLRNANADVARAELRVSAARQAMQEFRESERIADPVMRAGSAQQLVSNLEAELARVDAEINSAEAFLQPDAPSMIVLQARKSSLEGQINQARGQIDGSSAVEGGGDVARILSGFEELQIEQEFAQQSYTAALASLEAARAEADRNQRYLAVFVQPRTPERAKYPSPEVVIPLVFVFSGLAWIIGVLMFYGIREHSV